jgi:hypothetical protein
MRNTTRKTPHTAVQPPYAKPGLEPIAMNEGMVVRGVLGEIKPWSMGLIQVDIGLQNVILPAELEKKLKRFEIGSRIEVLRFDGYSMRRTPPISR